MRAVFIHFSRKHITIAASQTNNNTTLPGRSEFLVGRKTWTPPSDCPLCAFAALTLARVAVTPSLRGAEHGAVIGRYFECGLTPPSFPRSIAPPLSILSNRGYTTTDLNTFANMWLHCAKLLLDSAAPGGIRVSLWGRTEQAGSVCSSGRQEFFVCRRVSLWRLSSDGTSEASTEVSPRKQVVVCVGRQLSALFGTKSISNSFTEYSRIVCVSPWRDAGSVRKEDVSDVAVKGRYRSYSQTWHLT